MFKRIKTVKLTKLNISGNSLTDHVADDIATVLIHNTELEDIDLSSNELLSYGITTIFHGMKNILNLKRANISQNCITCEAACDIADVLSQNPNLQELYVSNNYFQTTAWHYHTVKQNENLTHLDINSNKITDEAADDIAIFLHHNSNLEVLDISNNLIQATGVITMFGRTNTNFCFKKLDLSNNALDDEAADTIAMFLSHNLLLEEFYISKNYLQAAGTIKIFKAVQNCPNIWKFDISNMIATEEAANEITVYQL